MGKVTRLKNKPFPMYQGVHTWQTMGSMWLIFGEENEQNKNFLE
jgi:hypothetical protein